MTRRVRGWRGGAGFNRMDGASLLFRAGGGGGRRGRLGREAGGTSERHRRAYGLLFCEPLAGFPVVV